MAEPPDNPDDLDFEFGSLRKSRAPWILAIVAIALAAFSYWLYGHEKHVGITVSGKGHLVVLPPEKGGAWALLVDGTLVQVTQASVQRLHAKTGPCEKIEGNLEGEKLELDSLDCAPGKIQDLVGARMHWMGLKFEYFDKAEKFTGDTLEPYLETPEVIGSMLDQRHPEWPQLVPLYRALYPAALARARLSGKLPPPLFIEVHRDDLQLVRVTRTELSQLMARPTFHLAAGGVSGGWIVRTLQIDPAADGDIESLLVDPTAPPWPERLLVPTVHVARRTTPPRALAGTTNPPTPVRAESP